MINLNDDLKYPPSKLSDRRLKIIEDFDWRPGFYWIRYTHDKQTYDKVIEIIEITPENRSWNGLWCGDGLYVVSGKELITIPNHIGHYDNIEISKIFSPFIE